MHTNEDTPFPSNGDTSLPSNGDTSLPLSPRTGLPMLPKRAPERTGRCADAPPDGLREGIAQFNRGEYWECHETLETLWRFERDPVRYLYQGILLAGVGLYHLQRGNTRGAVSKLRAALATLEPYAPVCMGVCVDDLRRDVAAALQPPVIFGPITIHAQWLED